MKKPTLQKHHYFIFAVAIIAGFLWGKYFYYGDNQNISFLKSHRLKILVEKSSLPQDVLEDFSKKADVPVEVETYSSLSELKSALQRGAYDIIWYKSYFAKELMSKNHLHKIALNELKKFRCDFNGL